MKEGTKRITIKEFKELKEALVMVNEEFGLARAVESPGCEVGLIRFQPRSKPDPRWISHADKEVVTWVLEGEGLLREKDGTLELEPGLLCHIPVDTEHDFLAAAGSTLLLLYMTVQR